MVDQAVVCCIPSAPRLYRYWLELRLAESGPCLAVILKNPSTATAKVSDPTVRRVSGWARRRGFGVLVIVNLFAFRATEPAALNAQPYLRAVGPDNDAYVCAAADRADTLITAWGNPSGITRARYDRRVGEVLTLLSARRLASVGSLTHLGYPRHGLFWSRHAELMRL